MTDGTHDDDRFRLPHQIEALRRMEPTPAELAEFRAAEPKTIVPYTPSGYWDDRTPLTPQETELAERLFRTVRYICYNTIYDGQRVPVGSYYAVSVIVDESQVPDARVRVEYVANEPGSGYSEVGVGPDLATAVAWWSDETATNGSSLLK